LEYGLPELVLFRGGVLFSKDAMEGMSEVVDVRPAKEELARVRESVEWRTFDCEVSDIMDMFDGTTVLGPRVPRSNEIFGELGPSAEKLRVDILFTVDGLLEEDDVRESLTEGELKLWRLPESARTEPLHIPRDRTWASLNEKSPFQSLMI
jgi:hypothetical protein